MTNQRATFNSDLFEVGVTVYKIKQDKIDLNDRITGEKISYQNASVCLEPRFSNSNSHKTFYEHIFSIHQNSELVKMTKVKTTK